MARNSTFVGDSLGGKGRLLLLALASALAGGLGRLLMARTLFLQADEEIFSYDAYYFIIGKDLDFIVGKIGAYIGYPFLLSLWFRVFGVSLFSARLFTVLCWMIVILVTFIIIFEITKNYKSAFAGSLCLALLPFPLRYGVMALSEPIAWVFVSGGILLLTLSLRRGRWYLYAISGALIVAASFFRRSALVLFFMAVPLIVWTHRGALKKAAAHASSFIIGFSAPLVLFIGGFIAHFGYARLKELSFFSIPNFNGDFSMDLSATGPFDNAMFALQPSIAKALPLFLMLCIGAAFMVASLMRDRWKAVYLFSALYPPIIRLAFEGTLSGPRMFLLMVLPVSAVLFLQRAKGGHRMLVASSALLAGSAAYSTFILTGDIWNVIIYTTVAVAVVIYLEDRISGDIATPALALVGGVIAITISVKEPQIEKLITTIGAVMAMTIPLTLMAAKSPPRAIHIGLLAPAVLLAVLDPSALTIIACLILAAGGIVIILIRDDPITWNRARYVLPFLSVAGIFIVPDFVPIWMIISILAVIVIGSVLTRTGYRLPEASGLLVIPAMAFLIAWEGTGEVLAGGIAASIILGTMFGALSFPSLMARYQRWIDQRVCAMIVMLVIAYLAFYVFYGWTEVYLTEFIVASIIVAGTLVHVLVYPGGDDPIADSVSLPVNILRRRRMKRPWGRSELTWRAGLMAMLMISIPCSIAVFLDDNGFTEGRMDKRPYMRTIVEISEWIDANTGPNEFIVAWHCYAVQADRQTILDVTNAAIYDGYAVIRLMEEKHVRVFVLCYYTNHGLWEDQPDFQSYILGHFRIDRYVDGNACFIRY